MDAWAWVGLAVYVLVYDTWALCYDRETLSGMFGRAVAHPAQRWPVVAAWGITSLHLFGVLPTRLDPFGGYATTLRRRYQKLSLPDV